MVPSLRLFRTSPRLWSLLWPSRASRGSPVNPRNDVLLALARLPPKRRPEHTVKGTRFFYIPPDPSFVLSRYVDPSLGRANFGIMFVLILNFFFCVRYNVYHPRVSLHRRKILLKFINFILSLSKYICRRARACTILRVAQLPAMNI